MNYILHFVCLTRSFLICLCGLAWVGFRSVGSFQSQPGSVFLFFFFFFRVERPAESIVLLGDVRSGICFQSHPAGFVGVAAGWFWSVVIAESGCCGEEQVPRGLFIALFL